MQIAVMSVLLCLYCYVCIVMFVLQALSYFLNAEKSKLDFVSHVT